MAKNLISSIRNRPKDTAVDPKKLVKLIYSSYQDQRPTTEYKKKNSFAPSTLGYGHGTCARYWIIAFDGTEFTQDTPAMNIASMDNGTDSHTRIQAAMEKAGLLKEKEREIISLKPPIRGFADIILEVDGKEIVGEIKTIKDQYFIARKQEMQPSNSHLLQVLIYMEVEGVDEGFLLYENKNDNELLAIPVVMSEKNKNYIRYVFDWMTNVYETWKSRELPKRGYTKSTWQCKGCPVLEKCNSLDPKGTLKIDNLKVGVDD
jgi:CRISPR/Cas system-associated exonuclease Cas4 (RecB family)